MATIKACPCCGQSANLLENHYGTIAEYWIRCPECGMGTTWYPTKDAAIAAWNQRDMPSPSAQLTAALGECALLTEACKELEAELLPLRKLREACQTVVMDIGCTSFDDATVEAEVEQWYGRLKKALAACQKEMIDDRT